MSGRIADRLDQVLVERGLAPSRSRARSLILEGAVQVGGRPATRPGDRVAGDAEIRLIAPDHPWVSRGGLKLAFGLDRFGFSPAGRVALDVGAATGGFTDVLLARGAVRVYAVDVGRGQLHPRLRADPRVVVHEQLNARDLSAEHIPERPAAVVCDASFIGLETVLPAALGLAAPDAFLVALIKPQFEVGPAHVGKGGVVRDPARQDAAAARIAAWLADPMGWRVVGVADSPIRGGDGNRELLVGAVKPS